VQTVESDMSLCPVLENFDEFVAESHAGDENEKCKCRGLNLFVCHPWEVFSLGVTFILSVEGLGLENFCTKRFFRLEKKQLLRIKWRRFLNEWHAESE